MRRVLHVISTLCRGGTESVVLNYFANIDKKEVMFDFLVVWGDSQNCYDDALLAQGCHVYRMKHSPKDFIAHGKELKTFFKTHKYDIVHIHAMSSLRYRVAKAAKKSGVKTVIYHSHNSNAESHILEHKLLKTRINRWCDYKFACSDAAGKFMYKGKYSIVRNAIDLNKFVFNETFRLLLRKKYGVKGKLVVGNIGRLTKVKNQSFLISVLKILKTTNSDAVLFIVGDGEEIDNLRREVEFYELSDCVIFAGNVGSEVYKYYSMFDCFAFPSLFEGLSMVLVEAQANGLPIVASDTISLEHKIADNFVFLPIEDSVENYSKWATEILDGTEGRYSETEKLRECGYDIKSEAKKLQDFYLGL